MFRETMLFCRCAVLTFCSFVAVLFCCRALVSHFLLSPALLTQCCYACALLSHAFSSRAVLTSPNSQMGPRRVGVMCMTSPVGRKRGILSATTNRCQEHDRLYICMLDKPPTIPMTLPPAPTKACVKCGHMIGREGGYFFFSTWGIPFYVQPFFHLSAQRSMWPCSAECHDRRYGNFVAHAQSVLEAVIAARRLLRYLPLCRAWRK